MRLTPKKTIETIIATGNHYLAAVKSNQPTLYREIQTVFTPKEVFFQINKGHGRTEKRRVTISNLPQGSCPDWAQSKTIIKVERERKLRHITQTETCYYISDLEESAAQLAKRIQGYWGVENRVHMSETLLLGKIVLEPAREFFPIYGQ
jgi:predicted transposase YbfD/YdcC